MMQGLPRTTQEGASIFINGFPSGPKPYEEVLTFLRKGTLLQKYGRQGTPKYHHFRLSSDDSELQWESKNGRIRRISIAWIHKWQRGQETAIFRKLPQPTRAHLSFSVMYLDEAKKERTLDVICNSPNEFELWFWGVQIVKHYPPQAWAAHVQQLQQQQLTDALRNSTKHAPWETKAQDCEPFANRSHSTEEPVRKSSMTKSTDRRGLLAMHRQQHVPSQALYSYGKRELGDLYVWGSMVAGSPEDEEGLGSAVRAGRGRWANGADSSGMNINPDPLQHWQQTPTPVLVQNTSSADVVRAAIGGRHAALVTRAGELYTWGCGTGGNLGLGTTVNVASPRQVTRMRGKGIKAVACSEGCTAAISSDGRMYTWGSGLAGQLGHGNIFRVPEPKLLSIFGDEVVIEQVSCGPYHTAAVSYDGTLYTWGNGLFGKLGHGDHESSFTPRPVLALAEHCVLHVSCGWWHTAAVGILCLRGASSSPAATPKAVTSPDLGMSASVSAPQLQLLPTGSDASTSAAASSADSAAAVFAALAHNDSGNLGVNSAEQPQILIPVSTGSQSAVRGEDSTCTSPHIEANSSALFSKHPSLRLDVPLPCGSSPARDASGGVGDCEEGSVHSSDSATAAVAAAAAMMRMSPLACTSPTLLLRLDDSVTQSASSGSDITSSSLVSLRAVKVKPAAMVAPSLGHSSLSMVLPTLPASESPSMVDSAAGGCLFTWGGEFSCTPLSELAATGDGSSSGASNRISSGVKRDHHRGCLGTGDKEGRLLPTRVGGLLGSKNVVQVACGWNLTVAVTKDGRAFQMGSTEGYNPEEKGVTWEGCTRPTQVDGILSGHHVEEVACGMHHVVVIASKLSNNGKLSEDTRRCRLMSWGKGAAGQLGTEVARDCNMPQIVPVVDGRRILNIACGGQHTLAVCEHNPRESSRRSYPPSGALAVSLTSPLGVGASHMPAHLILKATALRAVAVVPSTLMEGGRYGKQQISAAGAAVATAISNNTPTLFRNPAVAAVSSAAYKRRASGVGPAAVTGRLVGMPSVPFRRISSGTMGLVRAGMEGVALRLHSSGGGLGARVAGAGLISQSGSLKDLSYSSASASDLSPSPRLPPDVSRSSENSPQPAGRFDQPHLGTYSSGTALSRYAPQQLSAVSASSPAPLGQQRSDPIPSPKLSHTSAPEQQKLSTESDPGIPSSIHLSETFSVVEDGASGWGSSGNSSLPSTAPHSRYGRVTLESIASADNDQTILEVLGEPEQLSPVLGRAEATLTSASVCIGVNEAASLLTLGSAESIQTEEARGLRGPSLQPGLRSLSSFSRQPAVTPTSSSSALSQTTSVTPLTRHSPQPSTSVPTAAVLNSEERRITDPGLLGNGSIRSNSTINGRQGAAHAAPSSVETPSHTFTASEHQQSLLNPAAQDTTAGSQHLAGSSDLGSVKYSLQLPPRVSSHLSTLLEAGSQPNSPPSLEPGSSPLSRATAAPSSPLPFPSLSGNHASSNHSPSAWVQSPSSSSTTATSAGTSMNGGACTPTPAASDAESRPPHHHRPHSSASQEGRQQHQRQAKTVSLQHHSRNQSHENMSSLFDSFAPLQGALESADSSRSRADRTSAAAGSSRQPTLQTHHSGHITNEMLGSTGMPVWQQNGGASPGPANGHQPTHIPGAAGAALARENEELRRQVEALQRQLTTLLLVSNTAANRHSGDNREHAQQQQLQPTQPHEHEASGDSTAPPQSHGPLQAGSLGSSFGLNGHSTGGRDIRYPPSPGSPAHGQEPQSSSSSVSTYQDTLASPSSHQQQHAGLDPPTPHSRPMSFTQSVSPTQRRDLESSAESADPSLRPHKLIANKPNSLQLQHPVQLGSGSGEQSLPLLQNGYSPAISPIVTQSVIPRSLPPPVHHRRAISVDVSNFAASSASPRPPIAAFSAILNPQGSQQAMNPNVIATRSTASPTPPSPMLSDRISLLLSPKDMQLNPLAVQSPTRCAAWEAGCWSGSGPDPWVYEPEAGVFLYLQQAPTAATDSYARPMLVKVRYSRRLYTNSSARAWWAEHKDEVSRHCDTSQMVSSSTVAAMNAMPRAQSPSDVSALSIPAAMLPPQSSSPVRQLIRHSSQSNKHLAITAALQSLPVPQPTNVPLPSASPAAGGVPLPFMNGTDMQFSVSVYPMSANNPLSLQLSLPSDLFDVSSGSSSPVPSTPCMPLYPPSSKPQSMAGTPRYSPLRWPRGSASSTQVSAEGTAPLSSAAAAQASTSNWADVRYDVEAAAPTISSLSQLAAAARALVRRPPHVRSTSGGSSQAAGHARSRSGEPDPQQ